VIEMEIDSTGVTNFIGLLQTAVILISAIIYYFGVRWGETKVEEYSVASHYFAGILFIINYMLEPYLILLFVKFIFENYTSDFSINERYTSWVIYGLLIFEFILLVLFQYSNDYFRNKQKLLNNYIECREVITSKWLINPLKWLTNICMKFILSRFFPSTIIFVLYVLCKLGTSFEIILLSFVLTFLNFTNFAFCIGYLDAHYWKANLHLKNGKIINGIIFKYGSYINVVTEDGICKINKDDISTIKVSKDSKELCCDYFKGIHKN
jgi:hypothetical protein